MWEPVKHFITTPITLRLTKHNSIQNIENEKKPHTIKKKKKGAY